MDDISDHNALIELLGGGEAVASGIGESGGTVRAMKGRNKIPTEYWERLIAFAETKGIAITADWLMRTTPTRRRTAENEVA